MDNPYVKWLKILQNKLDIERACLRNGHSYQDQVLFTEDGILIETVIGGKKQGVIIQTLIPASDLLVEQVKEHLYLTNRAYKKSKIPKTTKPSRTEQGLIDDHK